MNAAELLCEDCGQPRPKGHRKCRSCRYLGSPEAAGRRRYTVRGDDQADDLGPELPPEPAQKLRPCIGCGIRPVEGWRYCDTCRCRLAQGTPLDLEAFPTAQDAQRLNALERSRGRQLRPMGMPTREERIAARRARWNLGRRAAGGAA